MHTKCYSKTLEHSNTGPLFLEHCVLEHGVLEHSVFSNTVFSNSSNTRTLCSEATKILVALEHPGPRTHPNTCSRTLRSRTPRTQMDFAILLTRTHPNADFEHKQSSNTLEHSNTSNTCSENSLEHRMNNNDFRVAVTCSDVFRDLWIQETLRKTSLSLSLSLSLSIYIYIYYIYKYI